MQPKHYAIIAGIVFILIITLQNIGSVRVAFLLWDFSISLIFILYLFLALGFLSGYMIRAMRKKSDKTPPEN